jgi:hypothetical protein
MPHTIDSALLTMAQAEIVRPAILCALDFAEGVVRLTSAPFDLTGDADGDGVAETYQGVGALGRIFALSEGAELQPYSGQLELSGVDPAMIALALGSHYQGRSVKLWLALLDVAHLWTSPPFLAFSGRMDTMTIALGATATITLSVQSHLADWENPRVRRYTNEDQQQLFPGDKGLEFVAAIVNKKLNWGGEVVD